MQDQPAASSAICEGIRNFAGLQVSSSFKCSKLLHTCSIAAVLPLAGELLPAFGAGSSGTGGCLLFFSCSRLCSPCGRTSLTSPGHRPAHSNIASCHSSSSSSTASWGLLEFLLVPLSGKLSPATGVSGGVLGIYPQAGQCHCGMPPPQLPHQASLLILCQLLILRIRSPPPSIGPLGKPPSSLGAHKQKPHPD